MSTMTLDRPAECAAQGVSAPRCPSCSPDWCGWPDCQLAPPPDTLPPLTDDEADRLIDRLAGYDERAARIAAQAKAMVREMERKRDALLFAEGDRLREWTERHLRGKARSVKRLVGTVGFRKNPARLQVLDKDAALAWARENRPDAVRESVDARALGERGEAVDGCVWLPEMQSFYVRGNKPTGTDEGEAADE